MTALALLVVTALPAWAHAGFVQSSVPADSAQELQLRVPGERASTYTVKVETLVSAGFEVTDCAAPAEFSCGVSAAADGAHVVTWERPSGGADPVDSGLVYSFDVRTPSSTGIYDFPTVQTYSDGEEAPWIGDQGADHPLPQLEVTGEATEVETNQEGPATDHGDATSGSDDAGTTNSNAGDDDGGSSDSSSTTDGSPPGGADTETDDELGTAAPGPDAAEDDSGAWPWLVAGLLAIAAAAAGVVGVQRLRAR